uniref:Uncharacterized protein AlNc14C4G551 n=1 Tax=Albugo laibachii Nc14 TaxID=890382 RepID=F0W0A9_9STRA|nr:conserved hypothetical protein [Albugo laibachii Nc14]|eukprot:CCA14480.1 conserved hypothetical protein [Albugo laibachii Nc14]
MTLEHLTSILAHKEHQTHRNSLIITQQTLSEPHALNEGEGVTSTQHKLPHSFQRVRVWKCVVFNPIARAATLTTNDSKSNDKSFRKMHVSELMNIVQKVFEDRWIFEVHSESSAKSIEDASQIVSKNSNEEIFFKLILTHLSQSSNAKPVSDQIAQLLAAVKHGMGKYSRIQTFASLLGVEKPSAIDFNPPEKIKILIHLMDRLYRLSNYFLNKKSKDPHSKSSLKREHTTDFLTSRNLPPALIEILLEQLFYEDYYWNFRFWHSHCCELSISYAWPKDSKSKLSEKILTSLVIENATSTEKFDGDWLLNTLLNEWNQRSRQIYRMLEVAADEEMRLAI